LSIRVETDSKALPKLFASGFRAIMKYIHELKQTTIGHPYAKYFNLDPRKIEVEIGIPTVNSLGGQDSIHSSETPEGKAVTCSNTCSYSEVEKSYRALAEWVKDNGYEAAGIAYDVFLNNPENTPPEKIQTKVYEVLRSL
jgi:effector-binding domain-containing protein